MNGLLTPTHSVSPRAPAAPAILSARELTVAYGGEPALDGATFAVRAGERVAIIGPNGAGKSTLFKALLGLIPSSGEVALAGLRRDEIAYVPQNEGVDWRFPVTVADVVMMGRTRKVGWLRHPGRDHWRAVDAALDRVGLLSVRGRQVGELSGGQRRRVFVARALAQEARLLMLDEPFSGVDASAQKSLMDVLETLNREDGLTLLLSTHDLDLAFRHFDRVMALRRRLIAFGTPQEVYTRETLAQMYGTHLHVVDGGRGLAVYVDDHACEEC
jgi:ABC-type Mn2+/Zn2+ transport system ATPase subunit